MTGYRNALEAILEASGCELPDGYGRWAMKSTRPDLTTRDGFQWSFPGKVTRVPRSGVDSNNTSPCPSREGDGLSVGLTFAGMASGGFPARTLLLVAVKEADVLGGEGDKLRVRAARVVALLDGEEYVRRHLSGADLSGANLSGADLPGANLSGANLPGAYLPGADLSRAYLPGANLPGADLSGANLSRANLPGANLSRAYLPGANLPGADLSRANLCGAYLSGADLSRANLSRANLSRANLCGAYLSGAQGAPDAWPEGFDAAKAGWVG